MATLAILPYHWAADLNSTLALARKLESRGHRVVFCCAPDAEAAVRKRGFEFRAILSEAFPPGSTAAREREEAHARTGKGETFYAVLCKIRNQLIEGDLDRAAAETRADALLVSSWTPWTAAAAYRTGLPIACFSSILISVADSSVPPFRSDKIPLDSIASRLRTRLSWEWMLAKRTLWGTSLLMHATLKKISKASGFPFRKIDFRVETWPRLPYPELILCPPEFDFPRRRLPEGARYVEACVDPERPEPSFPWNELRSGAPLVVCSLGSVVVHKYRERALRLFHCFLDAMAKRPNWQGVVASSRFVHAEELRRPDNVVLVEEAPQIQLLKRASLLVTHAGLTSVKESILLGVPMVALPFYFDQPGNAARIVHHGLGRRADPRSVTPAELAALMDETLGDPACREKTAAMSARFAAMESASPAVAEIERLLLQGGGLKSSRHAVATPLPRRS